MAAEGSFSGGGLPLESFNRSSPPGWKPWMPHYPFRRYMERLRLWYRQTELGVEAIGPAVAARLQGRPFNLAMSLSFEDQTGQQLRGDEALAYGGAPATLDAAGNVVVPAVARGIQQLLRFLER